MTGKPLDSSGLLHDGVSLFAVARNSSVSYIKRLCRYGLVTVNQRKIYLTEKGQIAKKIGVERYIETEKFEKEILEYGSPKKRILNLALMTSFSVLVMFLLGLLMHIILINSQS